MVKDNDTVIEWVDEYNTHTNEKLMWIQGSSTNS
jgi:hypothetical protein